jgi:DHA1 family inner membrane transport protein
MRTTTKTQSAQSNSLETTQGRTSLWAILALAISAFAIGTTEFVTTGLLPNIAQSFHISIPSAGLVTSMYALGVVVGAPLLTAITIRLPRKNVLIGLMLLFVAGSVVSAMASSFVILLLGRVLSAFAHGAFFGVGAIVVTKLVSPEKKAGAIALMFTGLTLANVLGVPMGTLLGQHFGWHTVFWVIAVLGLAGLLSILLLVPNLDTGVASNLTKELKVFKRPGVWVALLITAIGFSGLLASFAYVAPMMIHVAGFSPSSIVWLLAIYGVGLVIGNILGGKFADKNLKRTICILLIALTLTLFLFTLTLHYQLLAVINLFLLGAVGFAVIPALQMQVMHQAKGAPTLASASNISAFNLGVFIGVSLSGTAIHLGFGYVSANWVGAGLTTIGLTLFLISSKFK